MPSRPPDSALAKTVGKNLRNLRLKAKISQEELAERADVSLRFVQWIEAGQRLPSLSLAKALRDALKADWNDLLS